MSQFISTPASSNCSAMETPPVLEAMNTRMQVDPLIIAVMILIGLVIVLCL